MAVGAHDFAFLDFREKRRFRDAGLDHPRDLADLQFGVEVIELHDVVRVRPAAIFTGGLLRLVNKLAGTSLVPLQL